MMKCLAFLLAFVSVAASADRACRMVPEQKVKFKIPSDIRYPVLSPEKVIGQNFVIEQFLLNDRGIPSQFLVRAPGGGVHLAVGSSMQSSFGQKSWRFIMEYYCAEGDLNIFEQLNAAQERDWIKTLREMAAERRNLPKDKVLCRPRSPTQVSLDDSAYASGLRPRPSVNTFSLLGQVLSEADAPAEFQNIAFNVDGPAWRKAEAGMYLLRDAEGRIHAVKHAQLAPPSQNKLLVADFRCRPTETQGNSGALRVVRPEDLAKPGAAIEH